MRFVLVVLAALAAVPALAQQSDRPALPPPAVVLEFLRTTFGEMFADVTALAPQGEPGAFRATTRSADLPQFDLRIAERTSPELDLDKEANAVIGPARNSCQPFRQRGEAFEPLRLQAMTMLCPAGGEQRLVWVLVWSNSTTARTIMVSVPPGQSAALLARGDRLMAALNMKPTPQPRNLAEAVIVAYVHAGYVSLHEPGDVSIPSPTRAVLGVKDLSTSGTAGDYDVEAPACNAIMVREVSAGRPRFVERETRLDLNALGQLLTRDGINLRSRGGAFGESIRHFAQRPDASIRDVETVEEGVLAPEATFHLMMDSYLLTIERFCGAATPVAAQAPAAGAQTPAVGAQPPAANPQAANAQSPAAPVRTLVALPQGAELDRLVERLVRSVLPGASVARAAQPSGYNVSVDGRLFVASLVGDSVRQPGDREFSDQSIARSTQLAGCEAPRRLGQTSGAVGSVSWSAECPRLGLGAAMFVGVFHDSSHIHMFTLVGLGADRASIERANAIMAQPFAAREMAVGDALDTMEERAAYFAFYGLRRDAPSGICKAPKVSRSPDGRTLTFVSECEDPPEWTQTVTIERRSACRYGYTLEHDMKAMEEREEGELDFAEVDWSGVRLAGDMVSAEKALPARVSFLRMGTRDKPRGEFRPDADRPKPIQVDGLDVPNFEGQWHAIVQAFRAECPGRG